MCPPSQFLSSLSVSRTWGGGDRMTTRRRRLAIARVVPVLASVALLASGGTGWMLSGSNALGAPAETFEILRILRIVCAIGILVIALLAVPFLVRPHLLPAVGVSLFAAGMVAAMMLSVFLRDEPLLWVPAAAAGLCAVSAIVQLNISYSVRENRARARKAP